MNFVVYSKDGCPYCDKIKTVMEHLSNQENIAVKIYGLGQDFTKEQFYEEFGPGSTFPQVTLNGVHLGGCVDTVKYLQENKIL